MGTTKGDKETIAKLKAAKCSWHCKRGCWYFRPYVARHYGKGSTNSLASLAMKYGCREVREQEKTRRARKFALAS